MFAPVYFDEPLHTTSTSVVFDMGGLVYFDQPLYNSDSFPARFFGRRRLKGRSEKDRDCSAGNGNSKNLKETGERASVGTKKKRSPPTSSRNVYSLASHVHANLWHVSTKKRE